MGKSIDFYLNHCCPNYIRLLHHSQIFAHSVLFLRMCNCTCRTNKTKKKFFFSFHNNKTSSHTYLAIKTAHLKPSVSGSLGGGSNGLQPLVGFPVIPCTLKPFDGNCRPNLAGRSRNSSINCTT